MKFYKLIICIFSLLNSLNASSFLQGSGATLSEPAYYTLSYYFYKQKNITVYYESIGSFSGLKKLELNSVDFVSTDKDLEKDYLDKHELVQFPTLETSINISHNLSEIGDNSLKLTNEIIAKIYRSKIEYWDDERIVKLNKTVKLPHKRITVIGRKGDSGTTYNFTKHLYETTKEWKEIGTTLNLKLSNLIYAKNNERVALKIKETPYSIGYIPTPYAILNKLSSVDIQNINGDWKNFSQKEYPIKVINFTISTKKAIKENKNLVEFFTWMFKSGDEYIKSLGYTPLDTNTRKEYFDLIKLIKN